MADGVKVGVIGAGGSGIATGVALAQAGHEFEILEARDGVGGTWLYSPDGEGSACYASLVTNTSKLRTSLRAARIPGRPWQYAHHTEMCEYLEGIVERYGLRERIRLGRRVAAAACDDGGWVVHTSHGEERQYDALVCALGVNGRPRWAKLDGDFSGEQLHSSAYRTPQRFAGKDVLVIGLGTSGCEVVGELAGHARTVTAAVRSPMWGMTRRLAGLPIDWLDNPQVDRVLPWSWRRPMIAGLCRATTGRLRRYGVPAPRRRCGDDIIAVSDAFPRAVRNGLVDIRPDVRSVHGSEVRFEDGSATEVDVIVHATGFELPTDFLPAELQPHAAALYRGIVHIDEPRLHFVGLIEAHRALLPIAEAQAAWSADLLAGRINLPDAAAMAAAARDEVRRRTRDFGTRHPYIVDHARYTATLRRDRR
jgi:hypothetical protein